MPKDESDEEHQDNGQSKAENDQGQWWEYDKGVFNSNACASPDEHSADNSNIWDELFQ